METCFTLIDLYGKWKILNNNVKNNIILEKIYRYCDQKIFKREKRTIPYQTQVFDKNIFL